VNVVNVAPEFFVLRIGRSPYRPLFDAFSSGSPTSAGFAVVGVIERCTKVFWVWRTRIAKPVVWAEGPFEEDRANPKNDPKYNLGLIPNNPKIKLGLIPKDPKKNWD
jgi:hypothetical protein